MKAFALSSVLLVLVIACKGEQESSAVYSPEAENRAISLVNTLPSSPNRNPDIELELSSMHIEKQRYEHARFNRKYKGLRIIGGDLITHIDRNSDAKEIDQAFSEDFSVDTSTRVTQEDAEKKALKNFKGKSISSVKSSLVVFAHEKKSSPKLAWDVLIRGIQENNVPSEKHFFIDSVNSDILGSWDDIHTVLGTGVGYHNGTVALEVTREPSLLYSLKDPSRGTLFTVQWINQALYTSRTNVFGDGRLAIGATVAADGQYGASVTWDYFKNVHARSGIRNDGIGQKIDVHWGNNSNAFWSDTCFCATFGDGNGITTFPFVTLDIIGHEIAHGVTSATAKLVYSGESGGLNEATSDIFGTMVEYYANQTKDVPDYSIGEKVVRSDTAAVRYMHNPILDGASPSCYTPTLGTLDVHQSSGVANHFFYLLAEGSNPTAPLLPSPTCNSTELVGIGRDAAAKIWYRALTLYMVSNTNYAGARVATLRAAEDLFGISSNEANAVANAWAAVSVGDRVSTPTNLAPTSINLSSSSVLENLPLASVVGSLNTADPNPGDVFTYTLLGIDASAFTILGNQLLSNQSFNFESKNSYQITIVSTDRGGLSLSVPVVINIIDVNESPTDVSLTPTSVIENVPIGTVVGVFSTVDPDRGQSFVYSISGSDASAFAVVQDKLTTTTVFNRAIKPSYTITVKSEDPSLAFVTKAITIDIIAAPVQVNQAPTAINLTASSIAENLAVGSTVGILSSTDPNSVDSFTYSLSGVDAASFRIVGNVLQSNVFFNFETKPSFSISIRTTDAGGLFFVRDFVIAIVNVNEAPINIAFSPPPRRLPTSIGGTISRFSTLDPDVGDTFTYSISGQDSAAFAVVGNSLVNTVILNPLVKSVYNITVTTRDRGGLSFSKTISLILR